MIEARVLVAYCDELLSTASFADYAPNGLQVEGDRPIQRLVSGVTASAALLEAALALEADAIVVHHGWFWNHENPCLIGIKGRRARTLLKAGASLIAYHLPLDAHPLLGNNAMLGQRLGFCDREPTTLGKGLVWVGRLALPVLPATLAEQVFQQLGRAVTLVDGKHGMLERIAWCSGGGQNHLEQAAALGVDAFLSGEISEQTTHLAREYGICYLAAGHHATERYGIQALGAHLAEQFGLWHQFIEIDNPA
ncbi:Nif3-like dinuclear metal center hexameric protein [Chromatium okenii]|jgi:dinuclear metal center YbgI/SA1388 family protein|uniref:Nif3-like dinuclear metal center hexameric protein n=1 Tax=Chromatium okenii TaxID=61644 RepID=A0A2S7XQN0_9GAMM|nr:Nif3-like dinuclear metal center hexameric protein [Chromatium okenii]PQJ96030.1 Nif3-like dinuclear metal center hexameric protein [Chromatium okenii]